MRKSTIREFSGVIDGDTDPRLVKAGDYLYATNLFSSPRLQEGALSNELGTAGAAYTLPAGTNTVIGTAEDKAGQSIVYFVKNSGGTHKILRWYPKDNLIDEVASGYYLGFENRIHHAHVLDGNILVWTDGFSDAGAISGRPPRKLDMGKSSLYNKNLSYEMYAGVAGNDQFSSGDTITLRVKSLDGTLLGTANFTIPNDTHKGNPETGLAYLAGLISGALGTTFLYVEACDCKIKLSFKAPGWKLELTSSNPQLILVNTNHYEPTLGNMLERHIALLKEPPSCAPVPTYIGVPGVAYNNVRDGCFQFRSRFVYEHGELSSWSAISMTALNNAEFGNPQQSLNAISIDFTDDRLNDTKWLTLIKYVELAFRNGDTDEFKLIKRIPICEIGSVNQKFTFLNDSVYQTVASDDLSTASNTTQVISNYFPVPRVSGAIAPIAGEDGNLRLVLGANLEGFNCPDCVDASVSTETYLSGDLVEINGTVEIINDSRAFDTVMRYPNYALGGFVVYLAGTNYYAISDNPIDGTGTGAFSIKNVPKGRYTLRVASYMCRFDDSLGPKYNLQNGLEWQRTSAPVINCAGAVAANGYKAEREINLYGFGGSVFDLDTEAGYGTVQIQNCHHTTATPGSGTINLIEAYILDNDGTWDTLEARSYATMVEQRLVQFRIGSPSGFLPENDATFPSPIVTADHNGYAFASIRLAAVAANIDRVRVIVDDFGGDDTSSSQPYHSFAAPSGSDPDKPKKEDGWYAITGDFADDYQGLSGTDSNTVPYEADLDSLTVFCYQPDPAWTIAHKAEIKGRCVDSNGNGVADVLIWMMSNGRFEYTNSVGEFSIRTFADNTSMVRSAEQILVATFPADVAGDFQPTPAEDATSFDIDGDSNGIADVYTTDDFVFGFSGGINFEKRLVKSGGVYKIALIYEDEGGRQCGVSPVQTIRVPFHTEDGLFVPRTLFYSINHIPPLEAVRYRVLRTKDTFYLTYRQGPVGGVKYAVIPDGASTPTFTSFSNGNATHVLLKMPSMIDDPDIPAGTSLLMFRGPKTDGYRAKYQDRVRYILDESGAVLWNDRILEVDVLGEYLDNGDYYVVIPYSEIAKEIKRGWVFEFFTPKGFEEELYYETGVCQDVLDAGLDTRYHSGGTTNQVIVGGVSTAPATGIILSGDTYWWREEFIFAADYSSIVLCEHYRRSRFVLDACDDLGRPHLYDPKEMQTFFGSRIRFSGTYASGSQIDDIGSFGSLDYQQLNKTFGTIKWLGMVHTTLLCICQNKAQPIYVGKGRVMDLSGNQTISRSDAILNIANETMMDGGTVNPESVVVEDGHAFWWDLLHGVVWRFGQDGQVDMGQGRRGYFYARQKERLNLERVDDVVIMGYDRKHDFVFLTFMPGAYYVEGSPINVLNDTLAFAITDGGWKSHFTWYPEAYAKLNEDFVTFAAGKLWRQFKGAVYNYFHNSAHDSSVTVPFNEMPFAMKDWHCMSVRANKQWYSPSITTMADSRYKSGMKSRLVAGKWTLKEGVWKADFLRDENDPAAEFLAIVDTNIRAATARLRGRFLKGDVLMVKLQTVTSNQYNSLLLATADYSESQIVPSV